MNESIRLGRIAAVAGGASWRLPVVVVLVTTGLASGRPVRP